MLLPFLVGLTRLTCGASGSRTSNCIIALEKARDSMDPVHAVTRSSSSCHGGSAVGGSRCVVVQPSSVPTTSIPLPVALLLVVAACLSQHCVRFLPMQELATKTNAAESDATNARLSTATAAIQRHMHVCRVICRRVGTVFSGRHQDHTCRLFLTVSRGSLLSFLVLVLPGRSKKQSLCFWILLVRRLETMATTKVSSDTFEKLQAAWQPEDES